MFIYRNAEGVHVHVAVHWEQNVGSPCSKSTVNKNL